MENKIHELTDKIYREGIKKREGTNFPLNINFDKERRSLCPKPLR